MISNEELFRLREVVKNAAIVFHPSNDAIATLKVIDREIKERTIKAQEE